MRAAGTGWSREELTGAQVLTKYPQVERQWKNNKALLDDLRAAPAGDSATFWAQPCTGACGMAPCPHGYVIVHQVKPGEEYKAGREVQIKERRHVAKDATRGSGATQRRGGGASSTAKRAARARAPRAPAPRARSGAGLEPGEQQHQPEPPPAPTSLPEEEAARPAAIGPGSLVMAPYGCCGLFAGMVMATEGLYCSVDFIDGDKDGRVLLSCCRTATKVEVQRAETLVVGRVLAEEAAQRARQSLGGEETRGSRSSRRASGGAPSPPPAGAAGEEVQQEEEQEDGRFDEEFGGWTEARLRLARSVAASLYPPPRPPPRPSPRRRAHHLARPPPPPAALAQPSPRTACA